MNRGMRDINKQCLLETVFAGILPAVLLVAAWWENMDGYEITLFIILYFVTLFMKFRQDYVIEYLKRKENESDKQNDASDRVEEGVERGEKNYR